MYFIYGDKEIQYLKDRDKALASVIDSLGMIKREVEPDLFSALVKAIVGQQISTKAQNTIWARMNEGLGFIAPGLLASREADELQSYGISFRKAEYIKSLSEKVASGEFDIAGLALLPNDEVCRRLSSLKGVGVWTAEMVMLFSMRRPDILSYGDLAIVRGLRMLHRHRELSRPLFDKYRRRYSPYGSVASLYLWALAGGAIPSLSDPKR